MINEKKAQLDRLTAQCDSLARVDAEQKALLERLTNNESCVRFVFFCRGKTRGRVPGRGARVLY